MARASASASALRSTPTPVAAGSSESRAISRQPEPVPRSRIRSGARRSLIWASAASTTVSLSGRGISTAGVTWKARLQNSRSPRMYAIGSRALRRRTSSSRRDCSTAAMACAPPAIRLARSRPVAAASSSQASPRAVSMPAAARRPATRATIWRSVTGGDPCHFDPCADQSSRRTVWQGRRRRWGRAVRGGRTRTLVKAQTLTAPAAILVGLLNHHSGRREPKCGIARGPFQRGRCRSLRGKSSGVELLVASTWSPAPGGARRDPVRTCTILVPASMSLSRDM